MRIIEIEQDNTISMEVIALELSVLTNAVQTVKKYFQPLTDRLRGSNQALTSFTDQSKVFHGGRLTAKQKRTVDLLRSVDYMNLSEITISVPEGFRGNFLGYFVFLNSVADEMVLFTGKKVAPLYTFLSAFMTNKDAKISLDDSSGTYRAMKKEREVIESRFSEFLSANDHGAVYKYHDAFSRNADVAHVFELCNAVEDKLNKVDLKSLRDLVSSSVTLLDDIIVQIQRKDIDNVSPEAATTIAEGVYEVASAVESFAVNYYRALAAIAAMEKNQESLLLAID